MPRFTPSNIPESALGLGAAALLCLLSACPHSTPPAVTPSAQPSSTAGNAAGSTTSPADSGTTPDAGAAAGDGTTANAGGTAAKPPTPPDPGLMPGGGGFELARAQLGMPLAAVYGRYPEGQGWSYDARFIPNTHTGTVMAKPDDAQARATEMFTLKDGQVVGFIRVVEEDNDAFAQSLKTLSASYGADEVKPPVWALTYDLFHSWHKTTDESASFWSYEQRLTILTAGHRSSGRETVYMLLDMPRLQAAKAALDSIGTALVPDPDLPGNGGSPAPQPPSEPAPAPGGPPSLPAPGGSGGGG